MITWFLVSILCSIYKADAALWKRNNVCNTLDDYQFIDVSPNCWYNPDLTATVPETVRRYGYPLATYKVWTKDGYELTVFRLPRKQAKGVVFLQHPVTTAANVWIDKGNSSLGFLLFDAGYDVWMGNSRGTIYSMNHKYLSPNSNEYWNHSFHEMGLYDLPAEIDLVRQERGTKDKISYVGHSMGTTSAFIYNALLPHDAERNVKIFFELAPAVYLTNAKPFVKAVAYIINNTQEIYESLHMMNMVPHNGFIHNIIKGMCYKNIKFCVEYLNLYAGPDKHPKPEWALMFFVQNLSGFSLKHFVHYFQIIFSKRFQQYDYGKEGNILYYGTEIPPSYPVENVKVPHFFIYGGNDWTAVPEDVEKLYNELPKEAKKYGKLLIEDYNHVDTLYADNIREAVYEYILYMLENIVK